MCSTITVQKVKVRPGQSLKYQTLTGRQIGTWGLGRGLGAYNARIEKLPSTWKGIQHNRALVEVNNFEESGIPFHKEGSMKLAAVYDLAGDFVIITQRAMSGVEEAHHRMPVIIEDETAWLKEGIIPPTPGLLLQSKPVPTKSWMVQH